MDLTLVTDAETGADGDADLNPDRFATTDAGTATADPLGDLLGRLRWSVTSTAEATPGLGDRIRFAGDEVTFHQIVAGSARIQRVGEAAIVSAGDFVLLPRGGPHTVTALEPLELFSGTLRAEPGPTALTGRLPDVLVACRFVVREPLVGALLAGMREERRAGLAGRAGSGPVVTALGNAVAAAALRSWIENGGGDGSSWRVMLRDENIARAVDAIHADPGVRWTVAGLARVARSSRSSFAEQFKAAVGAPPLTYLARVRMERAMELLGRDGASVGQTAAALGYCSDVGFSRAFRRFTGSSPSAWRRVAGAGVVAAPAALAAVSAAPATAPALSGAAAR